MGNRKRTQPYDYHETSCKSCGKVNDINVIDKFAKASKNKYSISLNCQFCDAKAEMRITRLGYYVMLPYKDHKKIRRIKEGWVRRVNRINATPDTLWESQLEKTH